MKATWRLKLRVFAAKILIKLGKLTHVDYSATELKQAVDTYLPQSFPIDVPVSQGELNLFDADISMPRSGQAIVITLLGSVVIGPKSKPIYRAHVTIDLQAFPTYVAESNTVKLKQLLVSDVKMINDEYAIVEDSKDLLSLVVPVPFQNLLSGTMKSAFGLLTAGGSDFANDYLKLYLSGSKQRILDYHRPQIEALVSEYATNDTLQYTLDEDEVEEYLFCLYGREVAVEEGQLRFKF